MVLIHVRDACLRVVASGGDIVEGDADRFDVLGLHARTRDDLLHLVELVLAMPPDGHLVAVARLLVPDPVDELHLAARQDLDPRAHVLVFRRQSGLPQIGRLHEVVVDAHQPGEGIVVVGSAHDGFSFVRAGPLSPGGIIFSEAARSIAAMIRRRSGSPGSRGSSRRRLDEPVDSSSGSGSGSLILGLYTISNLRDDKASAHEFIDLGDPSRLRGGPSPRTMRPPRSAARAPRLGSRHDSARSRGPRPASGSSGRRSPT